MDARWVKLTFKEDGMKEILTRYLEDYLIKGGSDAVEVFSVTPRSLGNDGWEFDVEAGAKEEDGE
jgi:hypothetical protein